MPGAPFPPAVRCSWPPPSRTSKCQSSVGRRGGSRWQGSTRRCAQAPINAKKRASPAGPLRKWSACRGGLPGSWWPSTPPSRPQFRLPSSRLPQERGLAPSAGSPPSIAVASGEVRAEQLWRGTRAGCSAALSFHIDDQDIRQSVRVLQKPHDLPACIRPPLKGSSGSSLPGDNRS